MSVALIVGGALSAIAGLALARSAQKIPFPEKFVWLLGFGLVFVYGLCGALYEFNAKFMILGVARPFVRTAVQMTGTLALLIGAYSSIHKATISSHWYSLPTGAGSPLALLAQQFPVVYIQVAFCAVFAAHVLLKNDGKAWLPPVAVLAGTALAAAMKVNIPVVEDQIADVGLAVATLLMAFLCTGDKLKLK